MSIARKSVQSASATQDTPDKSVFSSKRGIELPKVELDPKLKLNQPLKMDGGEFLSLLPPASVPVAFFDPQYRGVLDKLSYGNEGTSRSQARAALQQMSEETIGQFIRGISQALIPSGHLFLWMDKFHLCTGFAGWLNGTDLQVVDMLTWSKGRIGMGYRTRRMGEHLVVLQKKPLRAKGVWKLHNIPDVWEERISRGGHTHKKPLNLQRKLIETVSNPGDLVIDPAAGSFVVMEACALEGRNFLGCDLKG